VMHKYDHLEPTISLQSFLEEVALVSEVDKLSDIKDDALTLMTLHLCKGLEFEHVMIAAARRAIFPHASSSFDREQLEEERRLMYVGMTRAKTHLRLFFTRSRMLYGETQANAPSRFLDDLPHEVVERRSDELLSAFAWATESGNVKARTLAQRSGGKIEPFRQHDESLDVEFNQDITYETEDRFLEGTRIRHPPSAMVRSSEGEVTSFRFSSTQKEEGFAISIAPLQIIG